VTYFPIAAVPNALIATGKLFSVGSQIRWIAAADFDLDGKMDIAAANSGQVSLMPGNGDGTFKSTVNSNSGCTAQSLAVGDFNNDGKPDVVVADDSEAICVMLGFGNERFTRGTPIVVGIGVQPYGLAVGDFNGDGKLDIAISDSFNKKVSILLGHGDG